MAESKPPEEKAESAKVAYNRMSISVPQELKDRMESCGEPVNWSALACRMFEMKLGEIAQKNGVRTVEDAISRLRLTKHLRVGERYGRGAKDGRRWAMSRATADQLERLEEFVESLDPMDKWAGIDGWIRDLRTQEPDYPFHVEDEGACLIAAAILGPQGRHVHPLEFVNDTFLNPVHITSEDPFEPSDKFVAGWVAGALEFWREVKDEL